MREGKENLSPDEVKTLQVGSDPDGGYWVTPDKTGRMVKKVYETSLVRQNASVQAITTDALEGVEDLGEAGAGYAGELAQGSDSTTPQIGKWRIPVFWIDTEPKATQQLLDDAAVDVEAGCPTRWPTSSAASRMRSSSPARRTRSRASCSATRRLPIPAQASPGARSGLCRPARARTSRFQSWRQDLRHHRDAEERLSEQREVLHAPLGHHQDSQVQGRDRRVSVESLVRRGPSETIAGFPVVRMEDISALGANSYSLAFGDLAQAYQIVDRQGIRVLRDPFTSKPFIKFYTTKRVGGGMVNFEAIKLMKFI
jgi:predicted phage gp36 major capsid-like protein